MYKICPKLFNLTLCRSSYNALSANVTSSKLQSLKVNEFQFSDDRKSSIKTRSTNFGIRKRLYGDLTHLATLLKDTEKNKLKIEELKKDIENLFHIDHVSKFPYYFLPGIYQSLHKIYGDEKNDVTKCLHEYMISCPKYLSLADLFYFLSLQYKFDVEQKLIGQTLDTIMQKINKTEIFTFQMVYLIYLNHELFLDENFNKIDQHISKLAPSLSFREIYKLFSVISLSNRRNIFVLKCLENSIADQNVLLTIGDYSRLIHCIKRLSFPSKIILDKISNDLCQIIPCVKIPQHIRSIMVLIATMKWKDLKLLANVSIWFEENYMICESKDLISFIVGITIVNYTPQNKDKLLDLILPRITKCSESKVWLNFVCSLVVLGKAEEHHLKSVLNSTFISSLPSNEGFSKFTNKHKLQIIRFANMDNVTDIDSFLDKSNRNLICTENNRKTYKVDVLESLGITAPVPKFLTPNIKTTLGFDFSGEIVLNRIGQLMPIDSYYINTSREQLCRVAVFLWEFNDFTIGEQDLLGFNEYAINLLSKYNYIILQVPYHEINLNGPTLDKLKYFQCKFKSLIL